MLFRDGDLRGIPVVTKRSGEKIGKLAGFVIDAETHLVEQYVVAKSRLLSALLPDDLLIHRSQVVSIDAERMVVEDAAVSERVAAELLPKHAAGSVSGGASQMNNSGL